MFAKKQQGVRSIQLAIALIGLFASECVKKKDAVATVVPAPQPETADTDDNAMPSPVDAGPPSSPSETPEEQLPQAVSEINNLIDLMNSSPAEELAMWIDNLPEKSKSKDQQEGDNDDNAPPNLENYVKKLNKKENQKKRDIFNKAVLDSTRKWSKEHTEAKISEPKQKGDIPLACQDIEKPQLYIVTAVELPGYSTPTRAIKGGDGDAYIEMGAEVREVCRTLDSAFPEKCLLIDTGFVFSKYLWVKKQDKDGNDNLQKVFKDRIGVPSCFDFRSEARSTGKGDEKYSEYAKRFKHAKKNWGQNNIDSSVLSSANIPSCLIGAVFGGLASIGTEKAILKYAAQPNGLLPEMLKIIVPTIVGTAAGKITERATNPHYSFDMKGTAIGATTSAATGLFMSKVLKLSTLQSVVLSSALCVAVSILTYELRKMFNHCCHPRCITCDPKCDVDENLTSANGWLQQHGHYKTSLPDRTLSI